MKFFGLLAPLHFLTFLDFYQELETTKLWFRSNREDHPHVFKSQVARKKSPLYMQGTLATLRSDHSPVFRDHCDAFRSLLDHLILSCTKPDEQQLIKYLLEVQILADSIYEVVFWTHASIVEDFCASDQARAELWVVPKSFFAKVWQWSSTDLQLPACAFCFASKLSNRTQ